MSVSFDSERFHVYPYVQMVFSFVHTKEMIPETKGTEWPLPWQQKPERIEYPPSASAVIEKNLTQLKEDLKIDPIFQRFSKEQADIVKGLLNDLTRGVEILKDKDGYRSTISQDIRDLERSNFEERAYTEYLRKNGDSSYSGGEDRRGIVDGLTRAWADSGFFEEVEGALRNAGTSAEQDDYVHKLAYTKLKWLRHDAFGRDRVEVIHKIKELGGELKHAYDTAKNAPAPVVAQKELGGELKHVDDKEKQWPTPVERRAQPSSCAPSFLISALVVITGIALYQLQRNYL